MVACSYDRPTPQTGVVGTWVRGQRNFRSSVRTARRPGRRSWWDPSSRCRCHQDRGRQRARTTRWRRAEACSTRSRALHRGVPPEPGVSLAGVVSEVAGRLVDPGPVSRCTPATAAVHMERPAAVSPAHRTDRPPVIAHLPLPRPLDGAGRTRGEPRRCRARSGGRTVLTPDQDQVEHPRGWPTRRSRRRTAVSDAEFARPTTNGARLTPDYGPMSRHQPSEARPMPEWSSSVRRRRTGGIVSLLRRQRSPLHAILVVVLESLSLAHGPRLRWLLSQLDHTDVLCHG